MLNSSQQQNELYIEADDSTATLELLDDNPDSLSITDKRGVIHDSHGLSFEDMQDFEHNATLYYLVRNIVYVTVSKIVCTTLPVVK